MLREAIELRLNKHPETSWAIAEVQAVLAECLNRQGRPDDARKLLTGAVPNLTHAVGAEDGRTQAGEALLASLPPQ